VELVSHVTYRFERDKCIDKMINKTSKLK